MVIMLSLTAFAIAGFTKAWFLTALPMGIGFGFFIQKGDICGAAAFSEILMNHDWRKLGAIWIAVSISMLLFILANRIAGLPLNPKPFLLWNAIIGGLVFGAGTVLAGGCISGCITKSGAGHINSIVAVLCIPVGVALIETGPLRSWFDQIKTHKITSATGGSVTLTSLTGIPDIALAGFFLLLTLFVSLKIRKRKIAQHGASKVKSLKQWLTSPWKPWQAGVGLGLVALLAFVSANASGRYYPMGAKEGLFHLYRLVTDRSVEHDFGPFKKAVQPAANASPAAAKPLDAAKPVPAGQPSNKVSWWLMLAAMGMFLGALASAALSGELRLRVREPKAILYAGLGGVLIGVGTAIGTGCVVGNILSGWALMSVGMFVFGLATLVGNWLLTHFYLMGGTFAEIPFTFSSVFKRR